MGILSEDAEVAEDEIEKLITASLDPDCDAIKAWGAGDWLECVTDENLGITATTTDDAIEDLAERIISDGPINGADIIEGLDGYLRARRDDA